MKAFKKWNDLQQFHEVTKNLNYPRIGAALKNNDYKIPYGLKVKLHGTNACVRIEPDGNVVAQKRSSDLVAPNENVGFRAWVEDNEAVFARLAQADRYIYIYGEWCGKGIQDNVACSMTPRKTFWVFAIDHVLSDGVAYTRQYEPELIETSLGDEMPDTVVVVPWHSQVTVDFIDKMNTVVTLGKINSMVEAIGEQDPLIKQLFDVEGHGEGLVAFPLLGNIPGTYTAEEEYFSWFNFKAKSEAHRVNKTNKAAQFDPEKFASIQIFADAYCTEQRLLQGFVESVQCRKDMRLTPDFIKWVVTDIWKESKTEREVSHDLDWKAVSKAISSRAVLWYKAKVQELDECSVSS